MRKTYIITLCIGIVAGGVLYFSWSNLGGGVLRQLGTVVGMYASVEPNSQNILAQRLEEREKELDKREQELIFQEDLIRETKPATDVKAIVYITSIGTLLLFLVLFNFYLDWKRRK